MATLSLHFILPFSFLILTSLNLFAGALDINVSDIREAKGEIFVYVCGNKSCHENIELIQKYKLEDKTKVRADAMYATRYLHLPVSETDVSEHSKHIVIDNLPPGDYSVFVLQTENKDGSPKIYGKIPFIDKPVPSDPFGISNTISFPIGGQPDFEDSIFKVYDSPKSEKYDIQLQRVSEILGQSNRYDSIFTELDKKANFLAHFNKIGKLNLDCL